MVLIRWATVGTVLVVILLILLALMVALYFAGRRIQRQQIAQQPMLDANTMTFSILVIDKKKMGLDDAVKAGLPEELKRQTPVYLRMTKIPVVKAKVGPKIMLMVADAEIFDRIPVKKEVKVAASGLYIREIKSVRGGTLEPAPAKKGLMARLRGKARESLEQQADPKGKNAKKKK